MSTGWAFCGNCGVERRAGDRFCPTCGRPFEAGTPTPPRQPGLAPADAPELHPAPAPARDRRPPARRPVWGALLAAVGLLLLVVAVANAATAYQTLAQIESLPAARTSQVGALVARVLPGALGDLVRGATSAGDPRGTAAYVDARRSLGVWLAAAAAGLALLAFGLSARQATAVGRHTLGFGEGAASVLLLAALGYGALALAGPSAVEEPPLPSASLGQAPPAARPTAQPPDAPGATVGSPGPATAAPQQAPPGTTGVQAAPVQRSDVFSVGPLARDVKRIEVPLRSGQRVDGSFTVSNAGRDIDFKVLAPDGTVLVGRRVVDGDRFTVQATVAGTYTLVWDNSFSTLRGKDVAVEYTIR